MYHRCLTKAPERHAAALVFAALHSNMARQIGQARLIHAATEGHTRRSASVSSGALPAPQTSQRPITRHPRRPKR